MKNLFCMILLLAAALGSASASAQRDTISIVGSSTVYPFSTVVAERFGRGSGFRTPKVESTGTGGGLKLFCGGVGAQYPDIANASRRVKQSELDDCRANGVAQIIEIVIGFDGIAVANSVGSQRFELSQRDLYLALAKDVPDPSGAEAFVANPFRLWSELNPRLPAQKIEVLGPPPTSGTRDAFAELVMESGCSSFAWVKALKSRDEQRFKAACMAMREDGAYIEAGENDNLIVQKLEANPTSLGIFGYSFLEENTDVVQGALIDGVEPDYETIADGSYPVSRPLYFYVKKAHIGVIPGIREFMTEFVSKRAMGEDGYLADRGLIALPPNRYKQAVDTVTELKTLE